MKIFLGVGLGQIRISIFLDGAFRGGFDRLVIADADSVLIQTIRENNGTVQIKIASNKAVKMGTVSGVEVYNPTGPENLKKLTDAVAQADEVATALSNIAFFKHLGWMKTGFENQPNRRRLVYAAENHKRTAEELQKSVGSFPQTHYLNTVIGKMSCIFPADECARRHITTLIPSVDGGSLVEALNKIMIQSGGGIGARTVQGLYAKADLPPFEEAKRYGHNAVHFWLGLHAQQNGVQFMHELADELFIPSGFSALAFDLLARMLNPFLTDRVDRVCRDLERKLSCNDRMTGTMRLVLKQGLQPAVFAEGAAFAA